MARPAGPAIGSPIVKADYDDYIYHRWVDSNATGSQHNIIGHSTKTGQVITPTSENPNKHDTLTDNNIYRNPGAWEEAKTISGTINSSQLNTAILTALSGSKAVVFFESVTLDADVYVSNSVDTLVIIVEDTFDFNGYTLYAQGASRGVGFRGNLLDGGLGGSGDDGGLGGGQNLNGENSDYAYGTYGVGGERQIVFPSTPAPAKDGSAGSPGSIYGPGGSLGTVGSVGTGGNGGDNSSHQPMASDLDRYSTFSTLITSPSSRNGGDASSGVSGPGGNGGNAGGGGGGGGGSIYAGSNGGKGGDGGNGGKGGEGQRGGEGGRGGSGGRNIYIEATHIINPVIDVEGKDGNNGLGPTGDTSSENGETGTNGALGTSYAANGGDGGTGQNGQLGTNGGYGGDGGRGADGAVMLKYHELTGSVTINCTNYSSQEFI